MSSHSDYPTRDCVASFSRAYIHGSACMAAILAPINVSRMSSK